MANPACYGFYRAQVVEVDISATLTEQQNVRPGDYGAIRIWIPDLDATESQKDQLTGLIAYPANSPIGGRDPSKPGSWGYGSCYVPRPGSWVWVFFEGGNLSKPFYASAINVEAAKMPPENRDVVHPHLVYTVLRTQDGRAIVVSDDAKTQRIELTGKKRKVKNVTSEREKAAGDYQDVYAIDENQTVIRLEEVEGAEKLIIKTHKGDYLQIDVENRQLHVFFKDDIFVETQGNFHLTVAKNLDVKVAGNASVTTEKNYDQETKGDFKNTVRGNHEEVVDKDFKQHVKQNEHTRVDKDRRDTTAGEFHLKVAKDATANFDQDLKEVVGKDHKKGVGGNTATSVKGNVQTKVEGARSSEIQGQDHVECQQFEVEAQTSVFDSEVKIQKNLRVEKDIKGVGNLKTAHHKHSNKSGPFTGDIFPPY